MAKSFCVWITKRFKAAIAFLSLTVATAPTHGETQVQTFDTSWMVSPWNHYGVVAARRWQYLPYKVWDSALGTLDNVEISTVVSGSRSSTSDVQKFRYSFFTGWNPADYQFYEEVEIPGGTSTVSWQRTQSFSGSALSDWLTYSYLPQATYCFESTTISAAHSIVAQTTLTYGYTPFSGSFTIDVASGVKTQSQAGRSFLSGTQSPTKTGLGTLVLDQINTTTGSTAVQGGVLRLAHASALPSSTVSVLAGGTLSLTPGLSTVIGGLKTHAGGLVDVGNGAITVAKGLSAFSLFSAIQAGRGSGSWSGSSGITSSAAATSNGTRTIGWLDNGNGSMTFGYAAPGDSNLDSRVDILDVAKFLGSAKFDSGLTATWAEGDFNYDGFADITDIADFLATNLYDTESYNTPAGSIAAVPEPSTLGLLGMGAGVVGLVAARRKRLVTCPHEWNHCLSPG
jgi:autotransporter-associated beta strand protein